MFSFCEFHDDDRDREVERPVFTWEIDESIYIVRRSKGSLVSSIRGILYARAKSSSTRKGGKMMTEMTLAVVPNKIRARSRRLRHVIHEQGEPSSSFLLLVLVVLWSPIGVVVLMVRWQSDENSEIFSLRPVLTFPKYETLNYKNTLNTPKRIV